MKFYDSVFLRSSIFILVVLIIILIIFKIHESNVSTSSTSSTVVQTTKPSNYHKHSSNGLVYSHSHTGSENPHNHGYTYNVYNNTRGQYHSHPHIYPSSHSHYPGPYTPPHNH